MNQSVQMPESDSIFVTGGGIIDFHFKCYKLSIDEYNNYALEKKASMTYQRVFHSMCYLDTNTIYVTGSREKFNDADRSVESYDIGTDTWTTRAVLPEGRNRHASCSF